MALMEFESGGHWPLNRWLNPCVIRLDWYARTWAARSTRIEHPFWVLDYSMDTRIRTRVGSMRAPWRERGARIAHLYPPRTPYWEWPFDSPATGRGGYVVFHLENDQELRRHFLKSRYYARILDAEEAIGPLLQEGARSAGERTGGASFWMAQSALCAILGILDGARSLGGEDWEIRSPPSAGFPDLAGQVEVYLRARLTQPVTLAAMAADLHMSRSSLAHRYKALTGTSPMQTLLNLRVARAKSLLIQGQKLDDIAEQCGFYDAAHLSRVFHAKTGQTPRHFARTM